MANPQQFTISVSQADSTHTDFSPVVNLVYIKNTGIQHCYINLNGAATTSHFKLKQDDEIYIGLQTITDVHAICDTGETTTLKVIGVIEW